jgi:alcohol dehydrogenase
VPASALVYEGPETVAVREFPLPAIGPDDLLVEVALAGVDGSEVHMLRGEMARMNALAPVIFGDEIVGRVAEIGERAAAERGLAAGDLVIVEARWPCHHCRACFDGNYYLCAREGQGEGGTGYGWISCAEPPHLWGGYATHVFVPGEALVYRVPDGLSLEAALICASVLANSYRWTKLARVELGHTVVVLGPGPQGVGCALASMLRGADVFVVGLEHDASRLAMAAELGVAGVLALPRDAGHDESVAAVRELCGGRDVDVVIEAAGAQATKDLAVSVVRPMGMFANVAVSAPARASVDWFQMLLKELTVVTPLGHPHSVGASLDMGVQLLARGIDPGRLVSHVFPLAEAERALRTAAYELDERPVKVAIAPAA